MIYNFNHGFERVEGEDLTWVLLVGNANDKPAAFTTTGAYARVIFFRSIGLNAASRSTENEQYNIIITFDDDADDAEFILKYNGGIDLVVETIGDTHPPSDLKVYQNKNLSK